MRNVAWRDPDGSEALIAFNATDATQNVVVNWAGQSFAYDLPANTAGKSTLDHEGNSRSGAVDCAAGGGVRREASAFTDPDEALVRRCCG
ncbi:glycoside hydrolase family 30 beta sandwich domain-containing protein [Saccharopolyspora sp. 5N102]|uniref:glycoside hydrolase family 30 beta sandwich domain-containing protein n=1 Tax=Saccharopolyspora sp. 5N102 TaxID=3375155 RepID=UPI0037A269E3